MLNRAFLQRQIQSVRHCKRCGSLDAIAFGRTRVQLHLDFAAPFCRKYRRTTV
jgi:hypothetical protein